MDGMWVLMVAMSGHLFLGNQMYPGKEDCEKVRVELQLDKEKDKSICAPFEAVEQILKPHHPPPDPGDSDNGEEMPKADPGQPY